MSIRDKIEANPFYWVATAAATGFVTCVAILGAMMPLFGLTVVTEGSHLSREAVEERFVARATYEKCRGALASTGGNPARTDGRTATGALDGSPGFRSEVPASDRRVSEPALGDTGSPARSAEWTVDSKWFRFELVSLESTGDRLTALVEVRPKGEDPVKFNLHPGQTHLLDHEGRRWDASVDTAGFIPFTGVEILPGSALRSRIPFVPARSSGPVSQPQPPLTLTALENHSRQRILLEGLRPE